jgi:Asp-tRNA(Asn)/Glu-tRNA(Gln) amidotransferase A subunit family amidase
VTDELAWLPAWRLAALVRERELSPVEVVDAFLERIAELEPRVHAFLTLDEEGARVRARDLERELVAGADPGPLCGVPVSIKDQIWTAGLRTTAGSRVFAAHVPTVDSPCVARLRDAGAVVVGKTNTPEFGLFWRTANLIAPETVNPWDEERTAGGSSGGAAVTAALALTPVALGADGAGSIRLPAAFCGVVGLHPTLARVPRFGVFDGGIHFTGIGPLTRDVRDAALAQRVVSGPDPRDPTCLPEPPEDYEAGLDAGVDGLRLVWWESTATMPTRDDRVAAAARAAAEALAGGRLDESDLGIDVDRFYVPFHTMSSADRYARIGQQQHAYDDPALRSLLTPGTRDRFEEGRRVTGAEYSRAVSARFLAQAQLARAFREHDLILTPTTPFVAPPIPAGDLQSRPAEISAYTFLVNFTGATAATVPCGEVDGLPVGLQVIGPPGAEARVLQACRALEQARPWADRRPPLDLPSRVPTIQ